jgi:phage terminase small subunit
MAGQGRKPKSDAIRRAHQSKSTPALVVQELPVPMIVTASPTMMECWDWIATGNPHYTEQHIPLLVSLCTWWAVARQCIASMAMPDGAIVTKVDTPMGERQDPDIRTLAMASNQIRQLCSELGIGPLAEQKMGLMKVTTMTMAADLPEKIFALMDGRSGT